MQFIKDHFQTFLVLLGLLLVVIGVVNLAINLSNQKRIEVIEKWYATSLMNEDMQKNTSLTGR